MNELKSLTHFSYERSNYILPAFFFLLCISCDVSPCEVCYCLSTLSKSKQTPFRDLMDSFIKTGFDLKLVSLPILGAMEVSAWWRHRASFSTNWQAVYAYILVYLIFWILLVHRKHSRYNPDQLSENENCNSGHFYTRKRQMVSHNPSFLFVMMVYYILRFPYHAIGLLNSVPNLFLLLTSYTKTRLNPFIKAEN